METPVEEAPAEEVPAEEVPDQEAPEGATIILPDTSRFTHELLTKPLIEEDLSADEQAMADAGLYKHGEAELEQIIRETQSQDTGALFMDSEYRDTFGENGEALSQVFEEPKQDEAYGMHIADYEDALSKPEQKEKEPEVKKKMAKRRPRMKKGYGLLGIPHILVTAVWLAIAVAIGVSLGRMLWLSAAEVLAFGKPEGECIITISDGDNIDTIAHKLKSAGLIDYPELFKMYAGLTDAEAEISAGTFTLNSKYDYHALVKAMTYHSTAREEVEVLIPEGYTCAQVFALMEEKGVCTVEELEDYAATGELIDRWFLEGVKRGDRYCLEGYLFPDTYRFYTNDTPERVLNKLLGAFEDRFTDIMKERLETLNQRIAATLSARGYDEEFISQRLFTIREVVIVASMIEKETANDAESYDVSSVIYNRLTNPKSYPFLNIDATLIYALGGNIDPETGKTKPLSKEDLQMEHPYNTYNQKGLPPGPISNPGRNSLNAALDPTETDFYYYVYNPNTSLHLFAKNEKDHQKNVDYVRSLGG